ncbi:glutamate receptor 3-like [Lineus longissimus]|uniref:glutamate receptor 3-like n=1 Tax=Lineus longissimus TaxID=88925 RepID=UPI00315DBEA7
MDGEIDIAAAGHTITGARASVVDFADAYYFEPAIIMLKNPGEGSKLLVYLQPLHKYVWLCMMFVIPAMALVLWLFTKYSPFYTNQDESCYPQAVNMQRYFPCFWYMYGALLTQGGCDVPCSVSGRILVKVWWIFVLVMMATYTGNLIAFLTVTKVSLPITNLNELAEQSKLGYGTVRGSALWNLLMKSTKGPPQRVWAGMDKENQPDTYADGKKMVLEGKFVMIAERSFYEDEAANNCDLKKVPKKEFFFGSYGIGVPKGSPLKRMFSEQIQRMIETGLMNKISKRWIPRQKCAGLTYSKSKPAKLSDTQGAFYVCGFGLIGAVVAFAVELAYFYLKRKDKAIVPGSADSQNDNFRTRVQPFIIH